MDLNLLNRELRKALAFTFAGAVLQRRLAQAGLLGLSGGVFLPQAQAIEIGTQAGAHIKVNDGTRIVADKSVPDKGIYGVIVPAGEKGTVDLGNNVSIIAHGKSSIHRANGIGIEADGSVLTANGLIVEITGKSETGIALTGKNVYADLGTGSQISATSDKGIIVGDTSTLVADRLIVEMSDKSECALCINGSADLGSGSTIRVDEDSTGLIVKGIDSDGIAYRSPASFTATGLTVESGNDTSAFTVKDVIRIERNAVVDLGSGSIINSRGSYRTAVAIYNADDSDSVEYSPRFTATGLTIDAQGYSSKGISVQGNAIIDLGNDSVINTKGDLSKGIATYDPDNQDSVENGPRVTATDLTIDTQGDAARGIDMQANAIVDLGGDTLIKSSGKGAIGIYNDGGEITANSLTIYNASDREGSGGIYNRKGNISVKTLTMFVTGPGAHEGLNMTGGTANIGAGSYINTENGSSLSARNKTTIINYFGTADKRNTIITKNPRQYSVMASFGGVINLKNTDIFGAAVYSGTNSTVTGENLTLTDRGVYAVNGGRIDLTGDLAIRTTDGAYAAIRTEHNSYVQLPHPDSRISAAGKMQILGGARAEGGIITLDMAAGSMWTGSAYSDNVKGGLLNVTMNNSIW
ncbi:hypothetical protein GJV78_22470, partial [Escherichia alba]|nr:hypothetical protein [Intestinirhabdus alba]